MVLRVIKPEVLQRMKSESEHVPCKKLYITLLVNIPLLLPLDDLRSVQNSDENKFRIDDTHRSDSIQGTDYIANYFFLNLRVSRAKIENPK